MLNQSSSNLHVKKGIDAIQKHKIRNLRAKLKNLLSNDTCNKYSKRQKTIKKIQSLENLQFYQTKTFFNRHKHLFTHTMQEPKHLFYSQKQHCNVMTVFGKLSKDEIQQIKEDMIYYLGQQNVSKFKQFLTIRENIRIQKEHNKENHQKQMKRLKTLKEEQIDIQKEHLAPKGFGTSRRVSQTEKSPMMQKNISFTDNYFYRKSIQMNHLNILYQSDNNKSSKVINLRETQRSAKSRQDGDKERQKFQAIYLGNRENFLNKRRMLQQEEIAQRFLNKVSLQMKQQKAVDSFRVNQDAVVSSIRQKNQVNDSKTKKILSDKYKKNGVFGDIVQLNEQLRKIYIKKISQIPKFSQIPQSQVIKDRKKQDTTLSSFFRETNHKFKQ